MGHVTKRLWLAAVLALALPVGARAQAKPQAAPSAATSDAPYTQGSVWELSFIRLVPGMGDDYLKSLSTTWKTTMEEAKKQGFIVSYKILGGEAAGPDDWDLLLMVEFKNFAALDGADAKFRAIEARTVGNVDQARQLMTKRVEVRRILGGKLTQELLLK